MVKKEDAVKALEEDIKLDQHDIDQMGYEDVIAGGTIKCRFKYRSVEPFQFDGLRETDLFVLPDQTLDQIAPMRYLATHRSAAERYRDNQMVKRRMARLREEDVDWSFEKGKNKRYRMASGIDPATFDEVRKKLEERKKEAKEEKARAAADLADNESGMDDELSKPKKKKKKTEKPKKEKQKKVAEAEE
jgi:hypothetical protein